MRAKLLIPLDGMPLAEHALPWADVVARALGTDVELLRVVPLASPASAQAEAEAYLARIASEHINAPVDASTRVLRGPAAECLVREAGAEHVGMVVMTTHARSGLRRAVLGSAAEYVAAHSPAPVLLVRAGCNRPAGLHTFLVTVDETCAAPMTTALELARAAHARVVLLRVVPPTRIYIWQWHLGVLLDEPEVVLTARQELNDMVDGLRAAGVDAESRLAIGSVVQAIDSVAAAIDADLIVMSTHARTGARRALLGSVADAVLRSANQPVLLCRLVPPPPGAPNPLDLAHALQHRPPPLVPQSIPESTVHATR